jgi:endoglucanase
MKRIRNLLITLVMGAALLSSAAADSRNEGFVPGRTSLEQAANMGLGWNLGNTLDAANLGSKTNSGLTTETIWGQPKTTQQMIKDVRAAGFKTIRVPVSWHNHIVKGKTLTIDPKWMARVKQIVDWAIEEDMCVIINIHHDNLSISQMKANYGFALSYNEKIKEQSKLYISAVWAQIAETFADYDNHLVFEVLNEPRDISGELTGNEWWSTEKKVMDVITEYEETAISTIRAAGGKNADRFVMVPGYAGSGAASEMLSQYTLPQDSVADRLILSTHAYSPYNFAMSDSKDTTFDEDDQKQLDELFSYLKKNYIDKGIGVVMGEASASDKNNTQERIKWAHYYFGLAKSAGIPVVLWDNNSTVANGGNINSGECHGYYNRRNSSWYFPELIEAMVEESYSENN